jgi:hypothetical protein
MQKQLPKKQHFDTKVEGGQYVSVCESIVVSFKIKL